MRETYFDALLDVSPKIDRRDKAGVDYRLNTDACAVKLRALNAARQAVCRRNHCHLSRQLATGLRDFWLRQRKISSPGPLHNLISVQFADIRKTPNGRVTVVLLDASLAIFDYDIDQRQLAITDFKSRTAPCSLEPDLNIPDYQVGRL